MDIVAAGKDTDMADARRCQHDPSGGTITMPGFKIHLVASRHRMNGRFRFGGRLVRRLLRCPQRPEGRIRLGGAQDEPPLSGCEDAVGESLVPTLPPVVGIGQIHNIVADVTQNIPLPFLPVGG